uniref:EamA domain-containing protein n=1 Tax=candidate division WOR-3 bacterium TaxID=2052148 RepID=A0A7C3UNG5_UNCW3
MDYRLSAFLAFLLWGIWAYFTKLLTRSLNPALLSFVTYLALLIPLFFFTLFTHSFNYQPNLLYAIPVGIISGVGTALFYYSLTKGPANVVLPFTSLYILIPVILSTIFLKEPLGKNHLLGIIFSLLAIFFLSLK